MIVNPTTPHTICNRGRALFLIVENEKWEKLLGQFDNGQRVRIILVKEDAK